MKYDLSTEFDLTKARARFEKYVQDGQRIELKAFKPKTNLAQNAYLHVVVRYFCMETGYTIEEGKIVLKRTFAKEGNDFAVYEKDGEIFLSSLMDYTGDQVTAFIDFVRSLMEECYGVYVPTSEEYLAAQFEVEKYLDSGNNF